MVIVVLMLTFLAAFSFVLGVSPIEWESRPRLALGGLGGFDANSQKKKKPNPFIFLRKIAVINKPLTSGGLRKRLLKDLSLAHLDLSPEEFFLIKEILIVLIVFITFPAVNKDTLFFWLCMVFAFGYMLPEFWLKGKIKKIKAIIIKELPDAIDLLRLCVNAGLDFMLALKWVVEKSAPSVMIQEFNIVLQEINLGKTRRDAIKDLAAKYDLPDLSTLSRTLIQADKMGTSVAEALNILSEDMRLARFRRGEQIALKAPLKMLIPLLLFIFPVVGVLVAGPILLDFMENNPMAQLASGGTKPPQQHRK